VSVVFGDDFTGQLSLPGRRWKWKWLGRSGQGAAILALHRNNWEETRKFR